MNSNVTRAVYVQETNKSTERRAKRRARLDARDSGLHDGSGVEATDRDEGQRTDSMPLAEILPLRGVGGTQQ